MTWLQDILDAKHAEVSDRKKQRSLEALFEREYYTRSVLSLLKSIHAHPPSIIAELKKASPSRGEIRKDFDISSLAAGYQRGGACAISVLTDRRFFAGSLEFLESTRRTVSIPVLRKDFVIDPYQVHEARAYGADAVLLIVAALEQGRLVELLEAADAIGLETLVEVHSEIEAERALRAGARIIGINNRDLHSFTVDLETTLRILPLVRRSATVVSESGFGSAEDILRFMREGVDGFLIGESLMRADDPGKELSSILLTLQGPPS